jgi:hypothetical protein
LVPATLELLNRTATDEPFDGESVAAMSGVIDFLDQSLLPFTSCDMVLTLLVGADEVNAQFNALSGWVSLWPPLMCHLVKLLMSLSIRTLRGRTTTISADLAQSLDALPLAEAASLSEQVSAMCGSTRVIKCAIEPLERARANQLLSSIDAGLPNFWHNCIGKLFLVGFAELMQSRIDRFQAGLIENSAVYNAMTNGSAAGAFMPRLPWEGNFTTHTQWDALATVSRNTVAANVCLGVMKALIFTRVFKGGGYK